MSAKWTPAARRRLLERLDPDARRELRRKVSDLKSFAEGFVGVRLRPYQAEAAEAVIRSVLARDGNSFVLLFARQSGKDELIANLILYLMARLAEQGASIICAQPTFHPQAVTAMDRLQARAAQRPFFGLGGFHCTHGFIYEFLSVRASYLSADPSASVVGATADRLLIVNEAQDVSMSVYDKRFAPMAASGNATRLFSGTAWTGDTLLDREKRLALDLEQRDGLRRVFVVDGARAARSNRLYAAYLDHEIARYGRNHPLVRTQYFCENIDARSRMFTPAHRALMACPPAPPPLVPAGDASLPSTAASPIAASAPIENRESEIANPIAFLLDVAGQEESNTSYDLGYAHRVEPHLNSSRPARTSRRDGTAQEDRSRDAVTLRIVEVDLATLDTLQAPTYRAVHLQQWVGQNHLTVFGQLKALAEIWSPQHMVIDATGVGEGLWAMLDKAFPTRVIPVKFTQDLKSELGYGFLAIINSGRFRDCCGYAFSPHLGALPASRGAGAGATESSTGALARRCEEALSADEAISSNVHANLGTPPHLDPLPDSSFGIHPSAFLPTRAQIDREYAACESEILIGPRKTMRWGVPDARRDEEGRPIHDDIPVTDSLTAILDRLEWSIRFKTVIIPPRDPLEDMDNFYEREARGANIRRVN